MPFLRGIAAADERRVSLEVPAAEAGGVPSYDTGKLQRFSPSVAELGALTEVHAKAWIDYWRKQGFLSV